MGKIRRKESRKTSRDRISPWGMIFGAVTPPPRPMSHGVENHSWGLKRKQTLCDLRALLTRRASVTCL